MICSQNTITRQIPHKNHDPKILLLSSTIWSPIKKNFHHHHHHHYQHHQQQQQQQPKGKTPKISNHPPSIMGNDKHSKSTKSFQTKHPFGTIIMISTTSLNPLNTKVILNYNGTCPIILLSPSIYMMFLKGLSQILNYSCILLYIYSKLYIYIYIYIVSVNYTLLSLG